MSAGRAALAFVRRHPRWFAALAVFCLLPFAAHFAIRLSVRLKPEAVTVPAGTVERAGPQLTRFADSYVLDRGGLLEVGLSGTPEAIGYSHSRLLYDRMVENEGVLQTQLAEQIPSFLARTLLIDLAQLRYREVDRGMSPARRREISGGALGFAPDPFASFLPTYQRFVYLNTLYDIALSFEHSPLVGCTTVAFQGAAKPEGGALIARAFDMEIDSIFDRKKAVFLVRESGKIPFASVSWPGLVGVVSGMNAEGVAVVVHGGRAGEPRTQGEPVVHALRRVLGNARTIRDALSELGQGEPLVSHIVIVADAGGHVSVVERVPGARPTLRPLPPRAAVTNHFEGPASSDPKNLHVLADTTSEIRRERADELVARATAPVTPEQALAILRDRKAPRDAPLPLGDRRAIDALIATHGVIFDTQTKTLWVSEYPHLLGRFVAFDLPRLLAPDAAPDPTPLPALPADPLLPSYRP
ncbi:MAG TPA: C45 family peptidase [Polyangiaceae bacterium]